MSTSLQKQILALSGKVHDERRLPKIVSFLFESSVAGNMDHEAVFQVGQEGISGLQEVDSQFIPFTKTLFHPTAKDFNRQLLEETELRKLDANLDKFLRLLSPYFMLKAAHSAIEFLVRRYEIHESNLDSVLRCVLPFHDTVFFGRMIQILKIGGTRWEWLADCQKNGSPLSQEVLVAACLRDHGVLEFIADIVLSTPARSIPKVVLSIFIVSHLETIKLATSKGVVQDHLARTCLTSLLTLLRRSASPNVFLASLVLASSLMWAVRLKHDARVALLTSIIRGFTSATARPIVMVLETACRSQEIEGMPEPLLTQLFAMEDDVLEVMKDVSESHSLYHLESALVKGALSIRPTNELSSPFVMKMFMKLNMSKHIDEIVHVLWNDPHPELFKNVSTRYSEEMDEVLGSLLSKGNVEDVKEFLDANFDETSPFSSSSYLLLDHPNREMRIMGLEGLEKVADENHKRDALLSRLAIETDRKVLKVALRSPIFKELIPIDKRTRILGSILARLPTKSSKKESKFRHVRADVFQLLADTKTLEGFEYLMAVVPEYPEVLEKMSAFKAEVRLLRGWDGSEKPSIDKIVEIMGNNATKEWSESKEVLKSIGIVGQEVMKHCLLHLDLESPEAEECFSIVVNEVVQDQTILGKLLSPDRNLPSRMLRRLLVKYFASLSSVVTPETVKPFLMHSAIGKPMSFIASSIVHDGKGMISLFLLLKGLLRGSYPLKKQEENLMEEYSSAFCAILVGLHHRERDVRLAALGCLKSLKKPSAAFRNVAQRMLEYEASFLEDPNIALEFIHRCPMVVEDNFDVFRRVCEHIDNAELSHGKLVVLEFLATMKSSDKPSLFENTLKTFFSFLEGTCSVSMSDAFLMWKGIDLLPTLFAGADWKDEKAFAWFSRSIKFMRNMCDGLIQHGLKDSKTVLSSSVASLLHEVWMVVTAQEKENLFRSILSVDFQVGAEVVDLTFLHTMLKELDVDVDMLQRMMSQCLVSVSDAPRSQVRRSTRKRSTKRSSTVATTTPLTTMQVDTFVSIVEAVLSKDDLSSYASIVSSLFDFVEMMSAHANDEVLGLDYAQSLLLLFLQRVLEQTPIGNIAEDDVRIEVVLTLAQSSSSTQIRNACFSVIGLLVPVCRDRVLEIVVDVFSTAQQDFVREDVGSGNVMRNVIGSIVPTLEDPNDGMMVLSKFCPTDISQWTAKRCDVFAVLAKSLQPKLLPLLVTVFLERSLPNLPVQERAKNGLRVDLDTTIMRYLLQILVSFDVVSQVELLGDVLNMLQNYTDDRDDDEADKEEMEEEIDVEHAGHGSSRVKELLPFFNNRLNDSQKELLTSLLLVYIEYHLSSELFLSMLTKLEGLEEEEEQIQRSYLVLLEGVLYFSRRRWPTPHEVFSALGAVNTLLGTTGFVTMVSELLSHEDPAMRRKALVMFNQRLENEKHDGSCDVAVFMSLLPDLVHSVDRLTEEVTDDDAIGVQTALVAIEVLARSFGAQEKEQFASVLPHLVPLGTHTDVRVCASANVTAATLCGVIGPASLPFLSQIVPSILKMMAKVRQGSDDVQKRDHVVESSVVALRLILQRVPRFLSPYYNSILEEILQPVWCSTRVVQEMLEMVPTLADAGVLCESLMTSIASILHFGPEPLSLAIKTFEKTIGALDRDALTEKQQGVFEFILHQLLSYRFKLAGSSEECLMVEDAAISLLSSFVLRLSDRIFRSFFVAYLEWASDSEGGIPVERAITFYRSIAAISLRLKTLFLKYFKLVQDEMIELLAHDVQLDVENPKSLKVSSRGMSDLDDQTHLLRTARHSMRISIVECFVHYFTFDTDGELLRLTNQFDIIVKTLMSILNEEDSEYASSTMFNDMSNALKKCVVALSASVRSSDLWKPLNHAVLQCTHASLPECRLAALHMLEGMFMRNGVEYLVLLPETIPHLAEMMEDNVAIIRNEVRRVIIEIEKLSGEDLQKYFE